MTIRIFPKVINSKVTGTYGKITDITEKKKLEHKLHKTINYLQNIVNSVNDAIIVSDNKGNRYLLNNKAKQVDKLLFNRKNLDHAGTVDIIAKTKNSDIKHLTTSNATLYDETKKTTGTVSIIRDITEKQQTAINLEESEKKYRTLVEKINEGLVSIDRNSRIRYFNKNFRKMLKIDESELIGKRFIDIIHPKDRKKTITEINKRKKRTSSSYELRLINNSGETIYTIISMVPVFDNKKYIGSYSVLTNITKRKIAEKELQESEEKYHNLVENAPLGIISIDRAGSIININSMILQILDISSKKTLKTMNIFTNPNFIKAGISGDFKASLRNRKPSIHEKLYTNKAGKNIYLRYHITPIYNIKRQINGGQAIVEDITEKKKTERALVKSKKKIEEFNIKLKEEVKIATDELNGKLMELSFIHELGKAITTTLDIEKVLKKLISIITKSFNYSCCTIILEEEGTLIPKVVYGMDAKKILKNIGQLNKNSNSKKAFISGESIIVNDTHENSEYIQINPAIQSEIYIPIRLKNKSIGIIVIGSKKKNAFRSDDIVLLNTIAGTTSIAINNARLYNQLRLSNIKLKELSNMKTEFISNVSHELRTPLTSIIGYVSLIDQGMVGEVSKETKASLNIIEKEAEKLTTFINDLLDISKIDAKGLNMNPSMININEIIKELTIYNLAEEKNIKIIKNLDSNAKEIMADRESIERIITNLFSNAVKFTQENGRITIRTKDTKDYIRIDVIDNGIGIEKNEIPLLFDKFHQVETHLTKEHNGTGLGLAIVYKLVSLHNGLINVDSKVGKGSTFSISIPKRKISHSNRYCWEKTGCSEIECPLFNKKETKCWTDLREHRCRKNKDIITYCSNCPIYDTSKKEKIGKCR